MQTSLHRCPLLGPFLPAQPRAVCPTLPAPAAPCFLGRVQLLQSPVCLRGGLRPLEAADTSSLSGLGLGGPVPVGPNGSQTEQKPGKSLDDVPLESEVRALALTALCVTRTIDLS